MKIAITLTLSLTLTTLILAQPEFNRENLYAPGDEVFVAASEVIPDPGMAGENRTWDFSTLPIPSEVFTISIADPDTTMFAADFPTANLAEIFSFDGDQAIQYSLASNAGLDLLGSVFVGLYTLTYNNPETFLAFPLTYNSQWQDTYMHTLEYVVNPITINTEGTINGVVDAYGTLILPNATFDDALRIKIIDESSDTSDLGQGLSEKNVYHDTSYFWMSPSYHGPLCSHTKLVVERTVYLTTPDTVIVDHETTEDISFGFDPMAGSSAIQGDIQPGKFSLRITPNPFEQVLQMEFTAEQQEEMQFILHDLHGNMIYQKTITSQAGENSVALSIPEMPAGTYIALLQSSEGADVQKLVRVSGLR